MVLRQKMVKSTSSKLLGGQIIENKFPTKKLNSAVY